MPARIYCDHNFVVAGHDSPEEYKQRLRLLSAENRVTYVLSTWHWLEMARDRDQGRGLSVADFADSLNPTWFQERRSVQSREVQFALFCDIGVEHQTRAVIGTLPQAIADLTGVRLEIANGYRASRPFVAHMQTLGEDHPINAEIQRNFIAQRQNGAKYRAGFLTDEMQRCLDRIYIGGLLPTETPGGVVIDRLTKDDFLRNCTNDEFPCFAVETALTLDGWRNNRVLNDRAFRDSQHVLALPYVDVFVTDDDTLSRAVERVRGSFNFGTAVMMTKAQFDQQFQ